jgi:hypothetical protein
MAAGILRLKHQQIMVNQERVVHGKRSSPQHTLRLGSITIRVGLEATPKLFQYAFRPLFQQTSVGVRRNGELSSDLLFQRSSDLPLGKSFA